jgi:cell volume regulation protein A
LDAVNSLLLVGASLVFGGIVVGFLSTRFGLPLLLVFLLIGMVAGNYLLPLPGREHFESGFLIANLALAVILLDGGLRTKTATFRVGLRPALSLASLGVLLTAAIMGAAGAGLFGFDWRYGLLLGAVVASTDAAAVFALLRASGTRLNDRVAATLEIESGINDPMAIFLTITLVELLAQPQAAVGLPVALSLLQQFGLGAAAGVAFGYLLSAIVARVQLGEGLYALLIASGGIAAFAATNFAGGSGFLAIYLVGLIVGNRRTHAAEDVLRAMDGLAWLAQSSLFLLLGFLVIPTELLENAGIALGLAAVLMLVARPLAVWLCLLPFRFTWRETAFISWVGLRGAVPIVLALFPVIAGLPQADLIFEIAFFVVLISLLLQGSTIAPAARLLGVGVPPLAEPLATASIDFGRREQYEVVQFRVSPDSYAEGMIVAELPLGPTARPVAVYDAAEARVAGGDRRLRAGDVVALFVPADQAEDAAGLFSPQAQSGPLAPREFFGEFALAGEVRLGEVATLYALPIADPGQLELSLEAFLVARLGRKPIVGDRVGVGASELTVREMARGRIVQVGLKVRRAR